MCTTFDNDTAPAAAILVLALILVLLCRGQSGNVTILVIFLGRIGEITALW